MATRDEIFQLYDDMEKLAGKNPSAHLTSVQMALIRRLADELEKANPNNSAAKAVLQQVSPGTRLTVGDGLALVGQLRAGLR